VLSGGVHEIAPDSGFETKPSSYVKQTYGSEENYSHKPLCLSTYGYRDPNGIRIVTHLR